MYCHNTAMIEQALAEEDKRLSAADARQREIDKRADELMINFNEELLLQLMQSQLNTKSVNGDIINQFIVDICYSQAEFELQQEEELAAEFLLDC